MASNPTLDALTELLPYLESLETRNMAILQVLKDKALVTDEQFVPYLEQAAKATNVKWLAARVRIERLLSVKAEDAEKSPDEHRTKGSGESPEKDIRKADQEPGVPVKGAASQDSSAKRAEDASAKPIGAPTRIIKGIPAISVRNDYD